MIRKLLKKYSALEKPVKASLWFTVCYILQRGIQYLSMPIYTRLMSTSEYGIYSLFLSWFNLFCVFSSLNIYWGTFNKAMVKFENKQEQYMSSVQLLTVCTTLLVGLLGFIFVDVLCQWTGLSKKVLLLMFVHLLMFPTLQYWSQKQRFDYKYKSMLVVTLSISAFTLIFGTMALFVFPNNSNVLITVTVGVKAVVCLGLFVLLFKNGRTYFNRDFWGWSLKMAIPLIPHYLSEILLGHADRIMIGKMCGNAEAGIYNVAYQIAMAMTIIRSGIEASFVPWMYRNLKKENYKSIRKITTMVTFLMGVMTLGFMLVGPEILKIAATKDYYAAVWDMPAIMIGCFFIFVYTLYLNIEVYFEKKRFASIASMIAVLTNIVLNYICINKFGYLAAGYTTMVSYMIMSFIHYRFYRKTTKEITEKIFDSRMIFLISVMLIVSGVLCLLLYNFIFIRYLFTVLILVLMYSKRKFLIGVMKLIREKE